MVVREGTYKDRDAFARGRYDAKFVRVVEGKGEVDEYLSKCAALSNHDYLLEQLLVVHHLLQCFFFVIHKRSNCIENDISNKSYAVCVQHVVVLKILSRLLELLVALSIGISVEGKTEQNKSDSDVVTSVRFDPLHLARVEDD